MVWLWLLALGEAAAGALDGRWVLGEAPESVSARIDASVEAALAPYNVAIRALARPRLRAAATVCPGYELTVAAASFALRCGEQGRVEAPFSALSAPVTGGDGRTFTVSATREGEVVELLFRGDEGWQRTRYTPQPDGSLRVDKTIHSDRLGSDLSYHMIYARAAG